MKILYFANIAAEYRVPFFNKLNEKIDIEFIITKQQLNERIYNFGKGVDIEGNVTFLSSNFLKHYFQLINIVIYRDFEVCMIPPIDSLGEMIDAILIAVLAKSRRKKTVYFWEKWQPEYKIPMKKRIKNMLQKFAYKIINPFIDKILVPGKKSYNYFTRYLKCDSCKINQVINASTIIDKSVSVNVREKYGISDSKFVVLYLGRIVKFKGLDILIKAISKIKDDEVVLLIGGDGDYRNECEREVENLGMKNVIFAGKIPSRERHNYFRESNLFVLPSRNYKGGIEAWGLTINEAMEFGLPCIVSNNVGCEDEIVINEYTGAVFESDNSYDLYRKIEKIRGNEEFKNNLIKNSKEIVSKKFNYNNMANSFISEFKN